MTTTWMAKSDAQEAPEAPEKTAVPGETLHRSLVRISQLTRWWGPRNHQTLVLDLSSSVGIRPDGSNPPPHQILSIRVFLMLFGPYLTRRIFKTLACLA